MVMNVNVKLYGTLRRFSQPDTPGLWRGEIPPQTTIEGLVNLLGATSSEVSNAMINGEICPLDTEIPDGAAIILVTPMGGG